VRKTTISCDIAGCTVDNIQAQLKLLNIEIIFITDQTEGRSTKPYLSNETMDICSACMDKRLSGESIWGHGAQGSNTFYFKGVKPS